MKNREYIKMENRSADEMAACDYSDRQIEPMPLVNHCCDCHIHWDECEDARPPYQLACPYFREKRATTRKHI